MSSASSADREQFFTDLEACCLSRAPNEKLIRAGDFNAQLGSRRRLQFQLDGTQQLNPLGPWDAGKPSKSGEKVLQLALGHNLIAPIGFFQNKNRATWKHPRYRTLHQIDHWLVSANSLDQWFMASKDSLVPLIQTRQAAQAFVASAAQHASARAQYKAARKRLYRACRTAKSKWIQVNAQHAKLSNPGAAWKCIKSLQKGLQASKPVHTTPFFRTLDGSPTTDRAASDSAAAQHWQALFNKNSKALPEAIDQIRQRPTEPALGDLPTDEEIIRHTRKFSCIFIMLSSKSFADLAAPSKAHLPPRMGIKCDIVR